MLRDEHRNLLAQPEWPAWLIWSDKHGQWFRGDESGYTVFMHEAGRYTADEATRIINSATLDGQLIETRTDPMTGDRYESLHLHAVAAPEIAVPRGIINGGRMMLGAVLRTGQPPEGYGLICVTQMVAEAIVTRADQRVLVTPAALAGNGIRRDGVTMLGQVFVVGTDPRGVEVGYKIVGWSDQHAALICERFDVAPFPEDVAGPIRSEIVADQAIVRPAPAGPIRSEIVADRVIIRRAPADPFDQATIRREPLGGRPTVDWHGETPDEPSDRYRGGDPGPVDDDVPDGGDD